MPKATVDTLVGQLAGGCGLPHDMLQVCKAPSPISPCFFSLPMLRCHSISFPGAQGLPVYKIGLGRGKDGRAGLFLWRHTIVHTVHVRCVG